MTIQDDCRAALDAHEQGNWEKAHELVQQHEGNNLADWIHAMLHRDEGDDGNAGYWYRRAGKPRSSEPVAAERNAIRNALDA